MSASTSPNSPLRKFLFKKPAKVRGRKPKDEPGIERTTSTNDRREDTLVSWRIPAALDNDDGGRLSPEDESQTPRRALEVRKETHRRRRTLKASGDWLGIQGVNPHTGEHDVLTPTSSSDCDAGSGSDARIRELHTKAATILDEIEKAQVRQAQRELDKMTEKKERLRSSRGTTTWTRRGREWSSVAEPQLSPIAQSEPEEEDLGLVVNSGKYLLAQFLLFALYLLHLCLCGTAQDKASTIRRKPVRVGELSAEPLQTAPVEVLSAEPPGSESPRAESPVDKGADSELKEETKSDGQGCEDSETPKGSDARQNGRICFHIHHHHYWLLQDSRSTSFPASSYTDIKSDNPGDRRGRRCRGNGPDTGVIRRVTYSEVASIENAQEVPSTSPGIRTESQNGGIKNQSRHSSAPTSYPTGGYASAPMQQPHSGFEARESSIRFSRSDTAEDAQATPVIFKGTGFPDHVSTERCAETHRPRSPPGFRRPCGGDASHATVSTNRYFVSPAMGQRSDIGGHDRQEMRRTMAIDRTQRARMA